MTSKNKHCASDEDLIFRRGRTVLRESRYALSMCRTLHRQDQPPYSAGGTANEA